MGKTADFTVSRCLTVSLSEARYYGDCVTEPILELCCFTFINFSCTTRSETECDGKGELFLLSSCRLQGREG